MTPERDSFSCCDYAVVIDPAVYSADNTPNPIDVRGYRAALISLAIGVGGITFTGTNRIDFIMTHSLDGGVTYNPVTAADVIVDSFAPGYSASGTVITNGIIRSLTAAHAAADVQKIGYIGGGSHVKLLADFSGTHATGTPISAVIEKEDGEIRRVA